MHTTASQQFTYIRVTKLYYYIMYVDIHEQKPKPERRNDTEKKKNIIIFKNRKKKFITHSVRDRQQHLMNERKNKNQITIINELPKRE